MHTFKEGDTVKLSLSVKNHECPEGRDDNSTAVIRATYGEDGRCCHLDQDLHGCRFWNMDDLEPVE